MVDTSTNKLGFFMPTGEQVSFCAHAAMGGARRDEEKSRAKERIYSFRDKHHRWNPKEQRPELWNIFNGRKHMGEHFRVFPISNWTELDVWQYLAIENIPLPSLYFSHERDVFERDGILLADCDYIQKKPTYFLLHRYLSDIAFQILILLPL